MSELRCELWNCEATLLQEIACKDFTRESVALTYALTLCSSERPTINWGKVNEAIVARWSFSALEWIKKRAWKLIEEKRKAAGEP